MLILISFFIVNYHSLIMTMQCLSLLTKGEVKKIRYNFKFFHLLSQSSISLHHLLVIMKGYGTQFTSHPNIICFSQFWWNRARSFKSINLISFHFLLFFVLFIIVGRLRQQTTSTRERGNRKWRKQTGHKHIKRRKWLLIIF